MNEGTVQYGWAKRYLKAEGLDARRADLIQRRGQVCWLVGGGRGWGAA